MENCFSYCNSELSSFFEIVGLWWHVEYADVAGIIVGVWYRLQCNSHDNYLPLK